MHLRDTEALAYVKRQAKMFRVQSKIPGLGLVQWVLLDALVFGNRACEVFQANEWWFVVSEVDWLSPDDESGAFFKIIASPEVGDNCMRSEIVLNAFADAVWIISPSDYKMIKGDLAQKEFIKDLIGKRQISLKWGRIIAFLVHNNPLAIEATPVE